MNDKGAMVQYRDFRKKHLGEIAWNQRGTNRGGLFTEAGRLGFAQGRQTIAAFRQAVAEQANMLLQTSPENDRLVRRALRISPSVPLLPSSLAIVGQFALLLLPTPFAGYRAHHLLRRAGTFEGRKFIFEHLIQRTLPGSGRYYHEALDFALRRFQAIRSLQDLDALGHMDADLMKVAYRLGLRTAAEVRQALPPDNQRQKSHLLWLLVSEGVVRSTAELPWAGKSSLWSTNMPGDEDQLPALRTSLRCLVEHGVDRKQVAGILRHPLWAMSPGTLSNNLALLQRARVSDLSGTLEQVGDRLWRTPTTTWHYVVETIGARSAPEIAQFRRLLHCDHRLSEELFHELVSLGAKQDDLVLCQNLLAEYKPEEEGAPQFIDNLRLLATPPHLLNVGQLSQCLTYLNGGSDLVPFLEVLTSHNLGTAQAVLEFQCCFRKVSASSLNRILTILGRRGQGEPLAHVATWALNAGQGGYFDAYDYLVSACEMENLGSLRQALKLVPLGAPFLRYLVEVRRLDSLKKIREWYYKAFGIDGYRSWRPYDALDRVLLDDAFTRNQFNNLAANQDVVRKVVQGRVERQIGAWPWDGDETAKSEHRRKSEALEATIRDELCPSLPIVLGSTSGILLSALFEADGDGVWRLQDKLSRLAPLLAELTNGRGPSGDTLAALEVEAIALIYRTAAETVRSTWPRVKGIESNIRQLRLRPHYPMYWRQVRWQLRTELDRSGFSSLVKAARFAQGFRSDAYRTMFTACQHLSPKQLRPKCHASNVETMALHLGSLLALAQENERVGYWIRDGFEALARMDEESLDAYQRIGDLVDFFNVQLPDALDAHIEGYVSRLSQVDAAHWATRLGPCATAETGHAQLRAVLTQTRAKALPLYLAWAKRQHRRYKQEEDDSLKSQPLVALASKHPAAFFAKSAVQLCTAGNVEMWKEERHFHLVVFDPAGQRMAGMAMIYVQNLPELDRARRSLVIRAINPTEDMLAGHSPASIVETFLDVAVQIAEDNELGCVCFPELSGMHLMSNRDAIEKYLKERYVKRAYLWQRLGDGAEKRSPRDAPQKVETTFYAYENGQQLVETLYVVWRATEA